MSILKPNDEMTQALRACASSDQNVAITGQRLIAKALELPLQEGILSGDNTFNIFSKEDYAPGVQIEYPLDFIDPGTEGQYVAYTVPATGAIPEKSIKGDYIAVPTYFVGAAIDCAAKYMRDSNWNILRRMMEVMEAMFTVKINRDQWHALIAAGVGRNLLIYDSAGTAGYLSRRLVSLMKLAMRRNAGGNAASMKKPRLTDLYVSPEAADDPRTWLVSDVGEYVVKDIYSTDGDEAVTRYAGVNIHTVDELGVTQEYNTYFDDTLAADFTNSKVELVIGLDQSLNNSFVMPVRQNIQVYEDLMLHKQRRVGFWGDTEYGIAVLDNRNVLLGQF